MNNIQNKKIVIALGALVFCASFLSVLFFAPFNSGTSAAQIAGSSQNTGTKKISAILPFAYKNNILSFALNSFSFTDYLQTGNVLAQEKLTYIVDPTKIKARSVLVKNISTGEILFEKEADKKAPLASLTKLMTAVTVAEIQKNWKSIPSKIKLTSNGETLTKADRSVAAGGYMNISDLVSYMLLSSSNFAAHSLSHEMIPYPSFIAYMNFSAKKIGLENASFVDSVGLPVGEETKKKTNQSNKQVIASTVVSPATNPSTSNTSSTAKNSEASAKDVSKIMETILTVYPKLAVATQADTAYITVDKNEKIEIKNTNILLSKIDGIILGKTGFTDDAGGNLALVINKNGAYYSVIVLGSTIEGRFDDALYLATEI